MSEASLSDYAAKLGVTLPGAPKSPLRRSQRPQRALQEGKTLRHGVTGRRWVQEKRVLCKHGHPLQDPNLFYRQRLRADGSIRVDRECKTCHRRHSCEYKTRSGKADL